MLTVLSTGVADKSAHILYVLKNGKAFNYNVFEVIIDMMNSVVSRSQ